MKSLNIVLIAVLLGSGLLVAGKKKDAAFQAFFRQWEVMKDESEFDDLCDRFRGTLSKEEIKDELVRRREATDTELQQVQEEFDEAQKQLLDATVEARVCDTLSSVLSLISNSLTAEKEKLP